MMSINNRGKPFSAICTIIHSTLPASPIQYVAYVVVMTPQKRADDVYSSPSAQLLISKSSITRSTVLLVVAMSFPLIWNFVARPLSTRVALPFLTRTGPTLIS